MDAASWPLAWGTYICPRLAAASLPIQAVTIERTIPQAVNLSAGKLPATPFGVRCAIVSKTIAPQFSLKFVQLTFFRELKFILDRVSPSPALATLHAPIAWGITNVPAQSAIYAMASSSTYQHFGLTSPSGGGLAEFVRLKIMPGIWWTFLREGFATGGGLVLGPKIKAQIDSATGGAVPGWSSKFFGGLLAGWGCAFATMLPHNCALTAARMAQQGGQPSTISCFKQLMAEQGLFRALTVNFQQRCAVIAVVVACLNTADVMAQPELALAAQSK